MNFERPLVWDMLIDESESRFPQEKKTYIRATIGTGYQGVGSYISFEVVDIEKRYEDGGFLVKEFPHQLETFYAHELVKDDDEWACGTLINILADERGTSNDVWTIFFRLILLKSEFFMKHLPTNNWLRTVKQDYERRHDAASNSAEISEA